MTDPETNRQTIKVSPAVFHALNDAGLLVFTMHGSGENSWRVWGEENEYDDDITCTMITGERVADEERS